MASENFKDEKQFVPLDISDAHLKRLRADMDNWLQGTREDVEAQAGERARQRANVLSRVVDTLSSGMALLPDREVHDVLLDEANAYDRDHDWAEVCAGHDARRALVAFFAQPAPRATTGDEDADHAPTETRTTLGDDAAIESAVLQLVIHVQPARLTESELKVEIAGEERSYEDDDAVARAIERLAGSGIFHTLDGFVTPTRPTLRLNELMSR